jgi:hypothetical protein
VKIAQANRLSLLDRQRGERTLEFGPELPRLGPLGRVGAALVAGDHRVEIEILRVRTAAETADPRFQNRDQPGQEPPRGVEGVRALDGRDVRRLHDVLRILQRAPPTGDAQQARLRLLDHTRERVGVAGVSVAIEVPGEETVATRRTIGHEEERGCLDTLAGGHRLAN